MQQLGQRLLRTQQLRMYLRGQGLQSLLIIGHRSLLGEQKLQGLLAVLRDSISQHRDALTEAIEADDCTEVAHLAHRLAGSSDSLGFRALANVLRALEEAAMASDEQALRNLAPQVHTQLLRSQQTLAGLLHR